MVNQRDVRLQHKLEWKIFIIKLINIISVVYLDIAQINNATSFRLKR